MRIFNQALLRGGIYNNTPPHYARTYQVQFLIMMQVSKPDRRSLVFLSEWAIAILFFCKRTSFGFGRSHKFSYLKVIHSKIESPGSPPIFLDLPTVLPILLQVKSVAK